MRSEGQVNAQDPAHPIRSLVEGLRRRNVSDDVLNATLPTFLLLTPIARLRLSCPLIPRGAEPPGEARSSFKVVRKATGSVLCFSVQGQAVNG